MYTKNELEVSTTVQVHNKPTIHCPYHTVARVGRGRDRRNGARGRQEMGRARRRRRKRGCSVVRGRGWLWGAPVGGDGSNKQGPVRACARRDVRE